MPQVLRHIFHCIELLRAPGSISEALFNDNAALRRLDFNFRSLPKAFKYTSTLANAMHTYPLPHLLELAAGVPLRYDESAIRAALAALTVQDVNIMWVSDTHDEEGMLTERWCGPVCVLAA